MKNSELLGECADKGLRVGATDIETSPDLVYSYGGTGKNYINHTQIIVPGQVTSVCILPFKTKKNIEFKWDDSVNEHGVFDILRKDRDKPLLKKLAPKLNEFDLLLGQNINDFDIKKLQWRFVVNEIPHKSNILSLDMLKESRKVFYPESHKLEYKSTIYGYGGKIPQDMKDCIAVAMGSKKEQRIRLKYNGRDNILTEKDILRELDYYKLAVKFTNFLKLFLKYDEPTFCIQCAAARHRRFDVEKTMSKYKISFTCNNCDYKWDIKR